jgi:hypothetical protein
MPDSAGNKKGGHVSRRDELPISIVAGLKRNNNLRPLPPGSAVVPGGAGENISAI